MHINLLRKKFLKIQEKSKNKYAINFLNKLLETRYVYHFDWTALRCHHCGVVVENDKWQMKGEFSYPSRMEKLGDREGTYDYYLRRMKEENALKKQVGGQHYKDCNIQPVEYIFQNDLDYFEGNVVKYITRHRKKGEGKKDVEKAIHYAQLILELFYNEQANNV